MGMIQKVPLAALPSDDCQLLTECAEEVRQLDRDFASLDTLWRDFKNALLAEYPEA